MDGTTKRSIGRSLAKTVSWRIIGTIDTVLLGWLITGNMEMGIKIGGIELITKMILYFFHERAWAKIDFGISRTRSKTSQICDGDDK